MEVKASNEEVVVINLIPESVFKDVLVIDKLGNGERFCKVAQDYPAVLKVGVEVPAVIRVFKDRIEMDTITPRVLDDDGMDVFIDFKVKHKKFGYDNMIELNEFIKKITKKE